MDVIDQFINQYAREFDYYAEVAKIVEGRLKNALHSAGIRCIVTSRAKSIDRLRDKCLQRSKKRDYSSVDVLRADIADLAGVRVALYFPGERDEVDRIIARLFNQIGDRKEFPEESKIQRGNRFSGYSALHYRVNIRPDDLDGDDIRLALARVEIQVASVLMHGWSEVEHDLVYKPLNGDLSDEEIALLDQLNGLVHAGEIALEQLQKAERKRIEEGAREFAIHYELASFLLDHARDLGKGEVSETELGPVDILFRFVKILGIATPNDLKPYLAKVHERFDEGPLAAQVISKILNEDPENRIEPLRKADALLRSQNGSERLHLLGKFVREWTKLEQLLLDIAPGSRNPTYAIKALDSSGKISPELAAEIRHLRNMRNSIVHASSDPDPQVLATQLDRLGKVSLTISQLA
ncbi:GTP pyrophosphokinase [Nocardia sp. NPDC001965]